MEIIHLVKGRTNVYLIRQNQQCILIDTGTRKNLDNVLRALKEHNIHPSQIEYIILTHAHFDHVGCAGELKEITGAKIILHHKEMDWGRRGMSTFPKGTNTFFAIISELGRNFYKKLACFPSFEPDKLIFDRYDLNELGWNGYILHTPGHSPGSISVIMNDKYAFVGDTLFGIFQNSVYPPFADQTDLLIESWESLLNTACSFYYPGHGRCINYDLLLKEYNIIRHKVKYKSRSYVTAPSNYQIIE